MQLVPHRPGCEHRRMRAAAAPDSPDAAPDSPARPRHPPRTTQVQKPSGHPESPLPLTHPGAS
eukprot:6240155-Pyramimonas_sp.AAC.1